MSFNVISGTQNATELLLAMTWLSGNALVLINAVIIRRDLG